MWQGKESKSESKRQVYGYTKNQRCKRLLLDPQWYRSSVTEPHCTANASQLYYQRCRERYVKKQNKSQEKKKWLSKRSKVGA